MKTPEQATRTSVKLVAGMRRWSAEYQGEETRGTESAAFFNRIYGSLANIKRNDARPHPARTRGTDERMAGTEHRSFSSKTNVRITYLLLTNLNKK
ncbi:hypothetical protein ALC57_08761 [Trachymyrmex cornetzi]|uniref:Uncharacterized protein n=1 Tax=Trachymyrmex cornetzi TaxID=471704 RepID=A0A195E1A6_9HYME|nr:hypothetical protein ALC57_08761 [Trachymyrmex cornetzi]